jgi:histidyl-tRNA synthetase
LIRGLDYYNGLVFEIVDYESKLTLVGGGYYSNLISEVSENKLNTICFGSGMGVERVLELARIQNLNSKKRVFIAILDELTAQKAFLIRDKIFGFFDVEINLNFNDNFKKNMKKSDDYKSDYIIMIGQKEINNDVYTIKNKNTNETIECKENEILDFLIRSNNE